MCKEQVSCRNSSTAISAIQGEYRSGIHHEHLAIKEYVKSMDILN